MNNHVELIYTNYRGETAKREIIPSFVWFGSTSWHPEEQWLLRAFDLDKNNFRDFAIKDFGQPAAPRADADQLAGELTPWRKT